MDNKQREGKGRPNARSGSPSPRAREIEALRAGLEEATRERDQFKELLQRTQADFINFKRHVEEERQELTKQANADLIRGLLPVLDDFERAQDHVSANEEEKRWLEGVALVYRNLRTVLETHGLIKAQAQGQQFDPWEHEALLYEETTETLEGQVLRVIRDGYKLHDRVLRPAQVSIAKGPVTEADDSPSSGEEKEKEA